MTLGSIRSRSGGVATLAPADHGSDDGAAGNGDEEVTLDQLIIAEGDPGERTVTPEVVDELRRLGARREIIAHAQALMTGVRRAKTALRATGTR